MYKTYIYSEEISSAHENIQRICDSVLYSKVLNKFFNYIISNDSSWSENISVLYSIINF